MESIALYMRISKEDSLIGESASIENQRNLLYDFIKSHEEFSDCEVMEFCDDGYSGMNFERPGIAKLLSMAGSRIKCIIVKDFSRLGRNLVEVGECLDQRFPALGVRFIAVNENYDSKKETGRCVGLEVSLKAMVHDMYSRDLSEKVRSSLQVKMQKGEYLGAAAFYGYRRSETEKYGLEIDEPAAKVVRRIFYMAAEGTPVVEIAAKLNRDSVPTPFMYRRGSCPGKGQNPPVSNARYCWTGDTVRRVLADERYTGVFIGGKKIRVSAARYRTKAVPKEDWIVVEDMWEAVVSREIFRQAKMVRKRQRKNRGRKKSGEENRMSMEAGTETEVHAEKAGDAESQKSCRKFRGIVRCGNCGRVLIYKLLKNSYFYCGLKSVAPDSACSRIHLYEQELEKELLKGIEEREDIMKSIMEWQKRQMDDLQKREEKCRWSVSRLKAAGTAVFEDYAEGHIGREEYLVRKKELLESQEEEKRRIAEISRQLSQQKQNRIYVSKEGADLKGAVTEEIIAAFVKEIRVSSRNTVQVMWNEKFLCMT